MAKVLITEDYLSDIGDAIREKTGKTSHYTPGQMASAVRSIRTVNPTLISKSIASNGTYNASSDEADGYDSVSVNVPNSYASEDEGKVVNNGGLVAQESQNVSQNGTYDTTIKNQVVVSVPNTYTLQDEGKVVSSGALVAQESQSVSQNGTYNTTLKNQVVVSVPNTYEVSDNGKVVVNQALTAQTSKSISANGTHDTTANNSVVVDVPNSYAAEDEGKVVNNGALVSQGSRTITENGTYDTTLISELNANISGGGGSTNILSGTDTPTSEIGSDGTIYLKHTSTQPVTNLLASFQDIGDWTKNQAAFTIHNVVYENGESELTHKGGSGYERIFVPVDVDQNTDYTFVIEFYPKTNVPNGYGGNLAISVAKDDQTTTGSSGSYSNFGKTDLNRTAALDYSTYYLNFNSGSYTRVFPVIDLNITDNSQNVLMFKNLYFVKGTYTSIPIVGAITNSYLKNNGVWQSLIGSDIDDVNTGGNSE